MKDDIVSIWTSYSEQANELTNKRLTTGSIFLAIVSALLGLSIPYLGLTSLIASIVGAAISVVWCMMIDSFKKLSSSKFGIIEELESKMTIKPYSDEWQLAKKNKYIKITNLEMSISVIFCIGFIALLVVSVLKISSVL